MLESEQHRRSTKATDAWDAGCRPARRYGTDREKRCSINVAEWCAQCDERVQGSVGSGTECSHNSFCVPERCEREERCRDVPNEHREARLRDRLSLLGNRLDRRAVKRSPVMEVRSLPVRRRCNAVAGDCKKRVKEPLREEHSSPHATLRDTSAHERHTHES